MSRRNPYSRADHRTLNAKAQGYPARSVFKLQEIDERCHLLKVGQCVVDLGAAPGSWSMYVAKKIGPTGKLLAVDLQAIEQSFPANVTVLQGDALTLDTGLHERWAPYDVVLSDMAPKTTGDKFANAARSHDLFCSALSVAVAFGRPGGHFVGKLFMGPDFQQARKLVADAFEQVKVVKPKGTRDNSVEVFLVGMGRKSPELEPVGD